MRCVPAVMLKTAKAGPEIYRCEVVPKDISYVIYGKSSLTLPFFYCR